jgi:hypothetical protein
MLYAGALGVRFPRVVDKDSLERGEVACAFQLFAFYEAEKPSAPLQLRWQVSRLGDARPVAEGTLDAPDPGAAATLLTRAPEGDYEVRFELRHGEQVLRQWRQTFSVIAQLDARVEALARAAESHDDAAPVERMTVLNAREVLRNAQKGDSPETSTPCYACCNWRSRLPLAGKRASRAGARRQATTGWQRSIASARSPSACSSRKVPAERPIPLVVALHGAGGNEHLFFEGYGLGIVLKEAAKRGWAVIAPRAEAGLTHVGGALEAAQQLLPIDPTRIYLMGHSMGGAHSFAAIAQFP